MKLNGNTSKRSTAAKRGGQKKRKEQSYRASYCSHGISLLILPDTI